MPTLHTFPVPEFRKPGSSTSFFVAAVKTDEECTAVHEELQKRLKEIEFDAKCELFRIIKLRVGFAASERFYLGE